ncbi:MAG TPA: hypothetical protein VK894_08455 [Jiangellales bacterium]|nr:hypothetical protein [Jiangellales bacterium]
MALTRRALPGYGGLGARRAPKYSTVDADGTPVEHYEVVEKLAYASVVPGLTTPVLAYNGVFPGPTISVLPQGDFDVHLTVSDAMFARDGSLAYDDNSHSGRLRRPHGPRAAPPHAGGHRRRAAARAVTRRRFRDGRFPRGGHPEVRHFDGGHHDDGHGDDGHPAGGAHAGPPGLTASGRVREPLAFGP